MSYLHFLYFIFFCFLIAVFGKWVVEALTRVSRFLGWKEFVVAFFSVSLGAVLPEFFIGISSALKRVSELSLGNVVGQNIILFTLAPAICAFILKNLEMESKTVKTGSTFAVVAAFLPLLFIFDGELSRIDGIILISSFFLYIFWLFSKKERFTKVYDRDQENQIIQRFITFLKDVAVIFGGFFVIAASAQGIIDSALIFSEVLKISLPLVGILVVSLGTALPETYFAVTLARKGQSWMILGGLMGAVAVSSTLVLGTVALISPIQVPDFSPFAIARVFLIISAVFFLFFVRSNRRITIREGLFLLGLYLTFLIVEIIAKEMLV